MRPTTTRETLAGTVERPLVVIVVAYGDAGALSACLQSLEGRYPTTIVDNSSSAMTEALARSAGAAYLDPGENLGFGTAINRALQQLTLSECDVLLLNPDASIGPEMIDRLRARLQESPGLGCVAPAQHQPGSDGFSQVRWPFPAPSVAWADAFGLGRFRRGWGFVIASVLLVRGSALVDVGGFDEGFFLYAEEADWEKRATARGWGVGYEPEAVAVHEGAGTEADPLRRELRFHAGLERYVRKWHGAWGWRSYQVAKVIAATRRAVFGPAARRQTSARLARLYLKGPYRAATRAGVIPQRIHYVPLLKGPTSPERTIRFR